MNKVEPRIVHFEGKKLIGIRLKMSLTDNKTTDLWRSFMPRRNEIQASISEILYSVNVYDSQYFTHFNPSNSFEKWAAKEVSDFSVIPNNMEVLILVAGYYAVFDYKGLSSNHRIFDYIFGEWLPSTKYVLDKRAHFEVLGEKYKNDDPESEEEIWIPIRVKS